MPADRSAVDERAVMQALHDEHAAALWAFAVRLTGGDSGQAAEDVVQETLLRAWRNPRSPAFAAEQHGSARVGLYTVARRIVIDEWRARKASGEAGRGRPGVGRRRSHRRPGRVPAYR